MGAMVGCLALLGSALVAHSRVAMAQPGLPVFVHVATAAPVTIAAGATGMVTIKITIDKGYHVQGNNAKAPYVPTVATVAATGGVTAGKIAYPPSVKKEFTGETLPVYENKVDIKIPLSVAANAKKGSVNVPVSIGYQGCNTTSCYPPGKLATTVTVKIVAAAK